MDKAKHAAAVDALKDLILSELESEDRHRFSSVNRLALLAQQLLLANTDLLSPEDADEEDGDDIGNVYGVMAPVRPRRARRANMMQGMGGDQAQMVREVVAAIGPMLQANEAQSAARHRRAVADELNSLISARTMLGKLDETSPIQVRINEILAGMEKGDEDGLSMVPAVDVRRHQTGASLIGLDTAGGGRSFADREGRDPFLAQEIFEVVAVPEAVARDGNDRLGLDERAEPGVGRADHQGPERAPGELEAAPEANLGGALHEREDRAGERGDAPDNRRWPRGDYELYGGHDDPRDED